MTAQINFRDLTPYLTYVVKFLIENLAIALTFFLSRTFSSKLATVRLCIAATRIGGTFFVATACFNVSYRYLRC